MAVRYDVIAVSGTYTDKNGEEKKRWLNCGVVFDTKSGGLALKLEALPTQFDGWLTLAEPKARDEKQEAPAPKPKRQASGDFADDILFAPKGMWD